MNDENLAPSLKIALKRRDGSDALELELPLDGKPRVLGRDALCDFCLDSPSLAPRHAELALTPRGLCIRDLGSVNGVQVDGRRLARREANLRPGKQVALGDFNFIVPAQAGAGGAAAPGSRNKMLVAVLLVLCLATLAAWMLKRARPRADDSTAAGPAPALNAESNAPAAHGPGEGPALNGRADGYRRAAQLMQQGQYALYASNDYLAAATLLNESVALDPRNTQALGLLRAIRGAHMQDAFAEGMECIESGDIPRARRTLERMKTMSPADGQVSEFEAYLRGEEACDKAAAFLQQARYADVLSVLDGAKVLNEYKRQDLVSLAGRQIELAGQFKQADDMFNAWHIPDAQSVCSGLAAQAGLSFSQKADLAARGNLLAQAAALDALLAQSNDVAAIEAGAALLDSPAFRKYSGASTIALARMDDLRRRLGPGREEYEQDGRKAMADAAAAKARGELYEAARLNSRALKSLLIAGFAAGSSGHDAELARLRMDIVAFTGTAFNKAYVLESRGSVRDAAALYMQILDVAPSADQYAAMARKRLKDLRALLPAEQDARAVIDRRLKSGAAVLPAQPAPAAKDQAPKGGETAPGRSAAPAQPPEQAGGRGKGSFPAGGEEVIPSREKPFSSK